MIESHVLYNHVRISGKPTSVNTFLSPFVTELNELLCDGLVIDGQKHVSFKVRCFICDTPARAMIRGKLYNIAHRKKEW